jgi:CBS domain-containing protein
MKLNILVKEVMRKNLVIIKDNDSVKKAAMLMKNTDIGSVLVIDKKKNVIGIVTKSDIVYKFVAEGRSSVKSIMTRKIITVKPEDSIEKAAETMTKNHIEKLLVSRKNMIIGIISATDILKTEPGMHTILFEMLKSKGSFSRGGQDSFFGVCESCGNYSDELKESGGIWICPECENE